MTRTRATNPVVLLDALVNADRPTNDALDHLSAQRAWVEVLREDDACDASEGLMPKELAALDGYLARAQRVLTRMHYRTAR